MLDIDTLSRRLRCLVGHHNWRFHTGEFRTCRDCGRRERRGIRVHWRQA